jgi:hypothetical protein
VRTASAWWCEWHPNEDVDAEFENEAHALPFVDYLRLCFRWGGFSLIVIARSAPS